MDPARLSPQAVLYGADRPPLVMPPCVRYAGTERYLRKVLALRVHAGGAALPPSVRAFFATASEAREGMPA